MGSLMKCPDVLINSFIDEVLSAELYRFMAKTTGNKVFENLALIEEKHAGILSRIMREKGLGTPSISLSARLRARWLKLLSRLFGYRFLMLLMERSEVDAVVGYWGLLNDPLMQNHRDDIAELLRDEVIHEVELYEAIHGYKIRVENMKDAVYGMIDALIEIEAGVIGIAMATEPLVAGIAGLISSIAGSLSMSVGAYLSTKSENNASESSRLVDQVMSSVDMDVFIKKVEERLIGKGLSKGDVTLISKLVRENPVLANLVIEQDGSDTSPIGAAKSAGVFYILGALGPVLPFLLNLPIYYAIPLSITLTLLLLFLLTLFITLTSGGRFTRMFMEYTGLTLIATFMTFFMGLIVKRYFNLEI
ncbi:MAG: VIT1/CCC1 transporter family protein [Desulfurococcus sp.]|uniref:VIT1/CCC1 transporter family protein n=1 Tax=Desulfurococcus sp. TaxID=51678 RepID=UPI003161304F